MASGARASRRPRGGWPGRGVSILNGFVGDYLDRRGLPWSIAMTFVQDGHPLVLNARSLSTAHPRLAGRIVVLVHGWCCSEEVWRFADGESTYATCLQRDTGATPFAVRYNTGMPIADSGRDLARLLRALTAAYPRRLDEIVLIGHSMGGLVIRAACESSDPADAPWTAKVRHVFYLGTPHEGADLERFAQGATGALRSVPNPVTRLVGTLLRARDRGGRDSKVAVDDRDAAEAPAVAPMAPPALATLPWLPTARHWLLVGTLTDDPRHPVTQVLGDGLVRVPKGAAPGAGARNAHGMPSLLVLPGIHHLQLAHDPAVYATIRRACMEAAAPAEAASPA